jgi:GNAT superfamily N-acetyltransferase
MIIRVSFRAAEAKERDLLGALKLRSSLAYGELVEELQSLPEAGEVPIEHLTALFVAEVDGRVLGFATVLPNGEFEAELEDLFVAPEAWRKGIGRQLLAEAERRASALGAHALCVVANQNARRFYEACGYRQTGTVMTLFEPADSMRKDLA